ncbi:hypothetical protein YQE_04072, partial [Dendroctonus ponderosae]
MDGLTEQTSCGRECNQKDCLSLPLYGIFLLLIVGWLDGKWHCHKHEDRPDIAKNVFELFVHLVYLHSGLKKVTIEGKSMATAYDCKYIETSVGINHNVDELLVGILTQIRLKLENPERSRDLFRKRSSSKKNLHRNRSPASGAATPTTGSAQNSPKKYRGKLNTSCRSFHTIRYKELVNFKWRLTFKFPLTTNKLLQITAVFAVVVILAFLEGRYYERNSSEDVNSSCMRNLDKQYFPRRPEGPKISRVSSNVDESLTVHSSRTSASLKVRSLLGKVWARDSKSKSCENLHV